MSNNFLHLINPKPLDSYSDEEWEALCDGCGLCCLHRLQDVDTGEIVTSNVACKLLDCDTCICTDYQNRFKKVADCTKITPDNVKELSWLPYSCSYRTIARGEPLELWHYLVTGSRETVHNQDFSMRGEMVSESEMDMETLTPLEEN